MSSAGGQDGLSNIVLNTTIINSWHKANGAIMENFGGWDMPMKYAEGDITPHLATRKNAGLFDVGHMGNFRLVGEGAVPFLEYGMTNDVHMLHRPGMAQYHNIQLPDGSSKDDAYLYRLKEKEFLLVVNASNTETDWKHLEQLPGFTSAGVENITDKLAMFSLQGPKAQIILEEILKESGNSGKLPENKKNRISTVNFQGKESYVSRTGYAGEPIGFEIFVPTEVAVGVWEHIIKIGKKYGMLPVGLGNRDTLRLEAGLPLHGHELGIGPDGQPIPLISLYSLPSGRAGIGFVQSKGDYLGRNILQAQYEEAAMILGQRGAPHLSLDERLVKRFIWPIAVLNSARDGPSIDPIRGKMETEKGTVPPMEIYRGGKHIGWVTSGTVVPYWNFEGEGFHSRISETHGRRAIGLAYVDSNIYPGESGVLVEVKKGSRYVPALIVMDNLRAAPPFARPIIHPEIKL